MFRPAMVAFGAERAALPDKLTRALASVDRQIEALCDDVVPLATTA